MKYWVAVVLAVVLGVGFLLSKSNSAQDERQPGETRIDEHGVAQVWVPAGSFLMGTDEVNVPIPGWALNWLESEKPQHKVTIIKGYWIDRYEVTQESFSAFALDGGYENQDLWSLEGWEWLGTQGGRTEPIVCADEAPDLPQACITWYEAEAYAAWRGGRLPTQAEWEYAARGPDSLIYPYGDEFDLEKGNVVGIDHAVPVGSYPDGVSWVDAHDMSGNLMEWVNDWLHFDYYKEMIEFDPQGPETGRIKIEKGGWFGSNSFVARAAYHHFEDPPTYQDHHIGTRIVTDAE